MKELTNLTTQRPKVYLGIYLRHVWEHGGILHKRPYLGFAYDHDGELLTRDGVILERSPLIIATELLLLAGTAYCLLN